MDELIFQGIEQILKVIIGVGVIYLIRFLGRRFNEDEMALIKSITLDGVIFAQQVWGHVGGDQRYLKAIEKITDELNKRGINVSDERLEMFIESAVKQLKAEFGEHWPSHDEKER